MIIIIIIISKSTRQPFSDLFHFSIAWYLLFSPQLHSLLVGRFPSVQLVVVMMWEICYT